MSVFMQVKIFASLTKWLIVELLLLHIQIVHYCGPDFSMFVHTIVKKNKPNFIMST